MLAAFLLWLFSSLFGASGYYWLVKKYPNTFTAANYIGATIPCAAGTIVLLMLFTGYLSLLVSSSVPESRLLICLLTVCSIFGSLGLADDIYGDRSIGGLRGHFNALIKDKRLTTGAVKAIGGLAASVCAGLYLCPTNLVHALIVALTIALSANALNLTDTRPGRSIVTFLVLFFVAGGIGLHFLSANVWILFAGPLSVSVVLYFLDRSAIIMIGDTGANCLGSLLGLFWTTMTNENVQIIYLLALVGFHWWTESHSLSAAIDNSKWLKAIDKIIGVRK